MPRYAYKAVNKNSQTVTGVVVAENELSVEQRLTSEGLYVINLQSVSAEKSNKTKKISRRELVDLFNGFAALLDAGVDVSTSLSILAEETKREELKNVLSDLRINIESGVPLDEAMATHPSLFAPEICNLIRAGSYSGNLVEACTDVAEHVEWVDHLMADVKQATTYPVIIILAVLGLILLMFLFVVPQFAEIFESLNLELPLVTKGVLAVGAFTVSYWWLIIIGVIALIVAIRVLPGMYASVGMMVDRAKLKTPLFGSLILQLCQSRFSHNLALMLRAGVPIVDALQLLAGVVGNRVVAQAVREARFAVTEGRTMSDGLSRHSHVFTPMVMRMIVIGEESGKLEHCLNKISLRLDSEIPRQIKRLFGVLEPLIVLILISIVGLIAAAIFMPLFSLMGGISG
ncbi:MAG: type II secretion system F family protein [Gammaproteobacteria bacterium]|nr:type II secretion system F family protein [Gammaproteobacteria bacterium]